MDSYQDGLMIDSLIVSQQSIKKFHLVHIYKENKSVHFKVLKQCCAFRSLYIGSYMNQKSKM